MTALEDLIDTLPAGITPNVTAGHVTHSVTYRTIFDHIVQGSEPLTMFAVGTDAAMPRIPFRSSLLMDSSAEGTFDNVTHLLQSIITGDWTAHAADDDNIDPGYVWGLNVYTTTGMNPDDGNGLVFLGNLIETTAMGATGATIENMTGLFVEAGWLGVAADAHVNKITSLHVAVPKLKSGATAGTADLVMAMYVEAVEDTEVGTSNTYAVFVERGRSRFGGSVLVRTGADDHVGVQVRGHSGSQSAPLQEWQNAGGAQLGKFTNAGNLSVLGTFITDEGSSEQVLVGSLSGIPQVRFGTGDVRIYVESGALKFKGGSGTVTTIAAA